MRRGLLFPDLEIFVSLMLHFAAYLQLDGSAL